MLVMVAATALFALAAVFQFDGFGDGEVTTAGLVLCLTGFATLTIGGWIGGSIAYVHGMRVLNLVDEPTLSAVVPGAERKEEAA